MSKFPNEDAQTPQARRLQEWWQQLPMAYRVNALLYALGGLALVFLLVTLLSDDGSDVQVGAGVTPTTVATTVARPVTTPPPAPTTSPSSSTSSSSSSSSSAPPTTAATVTTRAGGTGTTASQNTTTTRPPDTTSATTTTTMPANCRNSSNPACGAFVWDPEPGSNAALATTATPAKPTYKVGEQVFFNVTVSDPDHVVNDNCSEVRFDNGAAADGPCSPPPDCPAHYGPWTPPAATAGSHTPNYINVWNTPGVHTATFKFRSWSSSTCLALDPYASEGPTVTATVTITE